jgi:hypothetical protein
VDYYFLIAELPAVFYGQPAPMPAESFVELCRNHLEPGDMAVLDTIAGTPDSNTVDAVSAPFLAGWAAWDTALRLNLARARAAKLKREGSSPVDAPDYPADAAGAARTAAGMESPLEAELYLDKARWDYLTELEGYSPFSSYKVFAYYLKLKLCERRSQFNTETGFAEYKSLYSKLMKS